MNKIFELYAKVKAWYSGLKPRERTFVLVGVAALVAVALIFSVTGGKKKPGPQRNKIEVLNQQRAEFLDAADKYAALKVLLDQIDGRLAKRPKDFDLYHSINELTLSSGIQPSVVKMDPGQSSSNDYLDEDFVDLVLQKIDLISLVKFMDSIQNLPGLVRIGTLSIKTRFDQSNTLDVVMRISAYKEKAAK